MKKLVVLSCTTNSIYDFFLPIAVRLWRKRIGYEPIVVLVGTEEDWSGGHQKIVYGEICGEKLLEFFPGIQNRPEWAVSMALRQNVSALNLDPDDVLMIGDVDLFPVDRDFYHRYDPEKNPVGIYYEEIYRGEYWPAYGISMPVRNWREVMNVQVGNFRGSVERMLTKEGLESVGMTWDGVEPWGTKFWTFDERYATFRVRNSRFSKDVATFLSFVGLKYPCRRKLPSRPSIDGYIDFHCSRPGWDGANWPDIRHMLAQLIPNDISWVDRYVETYRAAL